MLNIIEDVEGVKNALRRMRDFAPDSAPTALEHENSVVAVHERLLQFRESGREPRLWCAPENVILGVGGLHRYFVLFDGGIRFSTKHCPCTPGFTKPYMDDEGRKLTHPEMAKHLGMVVLTT